MNLVKRQRATSRRSRSEAHEDRLEVAREVDELGAALVQLDALAVVLDLGEHAVRAPPERLLYRPSGQRLSHVTRTDTGTGTSRQSILNRRSRNTK